MIPAFAFMETVLTLGRAIPRVALFLRLPRPRGREKDALNLGDCALDPPRVPIRPMEDEFLGNGRKPWFLFICFSV